MIDGNFAHELLNARLRMAGLGLPNQLPPLAEQIDAGDLPQAPMNLEAFNRQQEMMPMEAALQQLRPQQPPQQVGGPEVPVSNIANKLQELLGAKEPNPENFAQQALSKRFQPNTQDFSRALQQSAYGEPASGFDFADQRLKQELSLLGKQQGTGFDQLVNTYMSLPEGDPRRAIYAERLRKETTPASMGIPIPVYDPRTNMPTYVNREDIATGGYMPPPPAGYKYGVGNKLVPTQPSTRDQMRLQKSVESADAAVNVERMTAEALGILERYKTSKGATAIGTGEQILNVFGLADEDKLQDFERLDKISKDLGAQALAQFGGNDTDKELQISIQTNVDPKAGVPANLQTMKRKLLASQILQERPAFEEEWLSKNGSLTAPDVETGQTFTRAWMAHQKDMWRQGLAQIDSAPDASTGAPTGGWSIEEVPE